MLTDTCTPTDETFRNPFKAKVDNKLYIMKKLAYQIVDNRINMI